MNDVKNFLTNQRERNSKKSNEHIWLKIKNEIQRKKKRVRIITSFVSIAVLSFPFLIQTDYDGQLYSDTQFAKVIELESKLENELNKLTINTAFSDDRLIELHERLALLNKRIDQVKLEINTNPLNPNYHRLYVTMLKTKHRIIETLNQKG